MKPEAVDWENETVQQCANRAANRAIEAISRVGTLTTNINELRETISEIIDDLHDRHAKLMSRVARLEAEHEAVMVALGEIVEMITP